MKLVVKFGGTSLATVKDIKNVVKTVDKIAKKNKTVVVCSAVDAITDELIQISSLIEKGNKKDANRMLYGFVLLILPELRLWKRLSTLLNQARAI